ncbi:MAG: site-2 protease family protein [Nanoarchaeota archaeon]
MPSFYIYDISFLIVFSLFVGIFLYIRRHNLKREGIMYLYRTKVGIRFIDYVGKKYKKTLTVLGFIGVIIGYLLMLSMIYFLYKLVYIYLFAPEVVRQIKIPPLIPLIPYLPEVFKVSFLPPFYFTYWIISIAVIAIFHEFAHGIIAKRYNVPILTTGFGFLGPFLAAFVEPDEKIMMKKPKYQQIAILSAGVFTNFVLAIVFFLVLSIFFIVSYVPAGAIFNTYTPGIIEVGSISMIGGKAVEIADKKNILELINKDNLTDDLVLGNENQINFTKIISNNKTYYTNINNFKEQLEKASLSSKDDETRKIVVYEDLPAINTGLRGTIIKINGNEVKDYNDLVDIMKNFKPGEKIKIITKYKTDKTKEEFLEYNLVLAEDSDKTGRAIMGIGLIDFKGRILGKITDFFNFFKKPGTDYEPRFNAELIIFIYNLIWWLALINLSVALVNMWPVAIFDGGRMFFLTILAITKSERYAKAAFAFMTYLILGSLLLLMVGWFVAIF